jgi:hypothetical protein
MDPRVKTSTEDLKQQFDLSVRAGGTSYWLEQSIKEIDNTLEMVKKVTPKMEGAELEELKVNERILMADRKNAQQLLGRTNAIFNTLQESDMPPTLQIIRAGESLKKEYTDVRSARMTWTNANGAFMTKLKKLTEDPLGNSKLSPFSHPLPDAPGFSPVYSPDLSNTTFPKGVWSVNANGELTATEDQCIFTQKKYKNFVLDLEFKTAEGTNSGVIVHCSNPDNWIPNSVEIQIADDYSAEWSKADPSWQCAAIFGHLPADKKTVKHPGEWNRYTITCQDRQIWVVLNGEFVNYMDMSRWISGTQNPDGSDIPSWLSKPFATLPLEGHIGFQGKHAGAPIWFRNVRVRELK